LLTDVTESAMLRVHPDDVALLEGKLPRQIFAVGDASVARGSFVLESASTIVEDGPDLWLEQLAQAIDHVAVPGA
ncbi:flagellar biosynthesis protein FliH, partial [Pseudomonas sp. MPR-R2A5]